MDATEFARLADQRVLAQDPVDLERLRDVRGRCLRYGKISRDRGRLHRRWCRFRLIALDQVGHFRRFGGIHLGADFDQRSRALEDQQVEQHVDAAEDCTEDSGLAFCH